MLIRQVKAQGLLSFGPSAEGLELGPLNVLIGPNGGGKSNLLQVFRLLRALPSEPVAAVLRREGSIAEWLWTSSSGESKSLFEVSVILEGEQQERATLFALRVGRTARKLVVMDEAVLTGPAQSVFREVLDRLVSSDEASARRTEHSASVRLVDGSRIALEDLDDGQSFLSQFRDPARAPLLASLASALQDVALYADWTVGRGAPARRPQPADSPADRLAEDCSNLGLILNRLDEMPATKRRVIEAMRLLYEGITDFGVKIVGGTVQVFLLEGERIVPATRVSDGTLRWLCLLAILFQPEPPGLVALEEPELGLHPDLIWSLAQMLIEASERMQLVVTTHSDLLVDALGQRPESIVVCEREDDSTTMRRLDREQLAAWLESYSLGELWRSGELGGTRW